MVTVEEVNNWDRREIAERFLYEKFCNIKYDPNLRSIGGVCFKDKFINEVAITIDKLIPKRYFVIYKEVERGSYKDRTEVANKFKGKDNHEITKGLIHHFKENEREVFKVHATAKQISYLQSLLCESGYVLKSENMTMQQASEIIGFMLDRREEPSFLFDFIEYK